MDVAYDQIQGESLPEHQDGKDTKDGEQQQSATDLKGEFRDAYQTFQGTGWGATLGSLWGSVKKQGETYYEGAKRELASASDASRGVSELSSSTQTLTVSGDQAAEGPTSPATAPAAQADAKVPESLSADIMKEAGVLISQFRSEADTRLKAVQSEAGSRLKQAQMEAGKRLEQVHKAEEAADDALIKFGSSVRDYLRNAITITAPETDPNDGTVKSILFESKDHEGRRVVHATRFDAQLHVVHSNLDSFNKDPDSDEYEKWKQGFDVEKKTDAIAHDLAKYEQLRRAMEQLVPEKVEYAAFWMRYYFMRHVIEEQEQKRRDLLKAQPDQEEVGWGDEDEDDAQTPATPRGSAKPSINDADLLRPSEGRRSNDHSVADSDASYDIVSNNASRGPGSPKELLDKKKETAAADQSDEEDWE